MNRKDWIKYTQDILLNGNHIDDDYYQYMNDRYADLLNQCTRDCLNPVDFDNLREFIIRLIEQVASDETCILRLRDMTKDESTDSSFMKLMAVRACAGMFVDKVMSIDNRSLDDFKNDYKNGRHE